jgi:hypothetical protein
VLELLSAIAEEYRRDAKGKVRFMAPVEQPNEAPEAYLARVKELSDTPRGRGRPKALAGTLLARKLCDLLIAEGCGAGKSGHRPLAIAKLADFIHQHVVSDLDSPDWIKRVREASDPLWFFQEAFGLSLDGLSKSQIDGLRKELLQAEVKPPKRKKS